MKSSLRDNSLSLTMFGLFALILAGQVVTGAAEYNQDQQEHGGSLVGLIEYLSTGHFLEATFENWESEFLQMGAYVVLTVFLFQRGSAESKDPTKKEKVDEDPRKHPHAERAPWPVRAGGIALRLYENSLLIAFFLLFALSFALHAIGGAEEYSSEQSQHGGEAVTVFEYLTTSRFWFESLQNWQSEFLAMGAIVVLTIFLRQRGSAESKPVHAPHSETGSG